MGPFSATVPDVSGDDPLGLLSKPWIASHLLRSARVNDLRREKERKNENNDQRNFYFFINLGSFGANAVENLISSLTSV